MVLIVFLTAVHAALFVILIWNVYELRRKQDLPSADRPLPSLSVLIPARNEAHNLQRLVPQLLAQRYPEFEVVLYDDGSEDDTQEVLAEASDPRLHVMRGTSVPEGWVGKVHALYQATRKAQNEIYLFLDADVILNDDDVLERLIRRFQSLDGTAVLTGMTQLSGRGLLLVSLVPNVLLSALPWTLLRLTGMKAFGGLNGQCWMIHREIYHRHEPHLAMPDEVLEDVRIGQYLTGLGVIPRLADVRREIEVPMYHSFGDAWRGFRKNTYLLMGEHPISFVLLWALYASTFVVAPILHPAFLLSLYLLKGATDRLSGIPWRVTLLAPVSVVLAVLLQWDSAIHHWLGKVEWKGRRV